MSGIIQDQILSSLSKVYAVITSARNELFDKQILKSYKARVPVISIGNITAGGNAKTPLAIALLQELQKRGYRVALLTRGYGSKVKGPYVVKDADDAHKVGDEALLIYQKTGLPVVISPKRALGAAYITEKKIADLIVMDDGFQHRALARDLDIVSIDVGSKKAVDDFLAGNLLPLGRFREERDRALKRASIVVFSYRRYLKELPQIDHHLLEIVPKDLPTFVTTVEPKKISCLVGEEEFNPKAGVVAFCAIAKPERFFDTLSDMGVNLIGKESFADHHKFTLEDLKRLRTKYHDSSFICTEKDAVKLLALREHNSLDNIFKLEIETVIHDKERFIDNVVDTVTKCNMKKGTLKK